MTPGKMDVSYFMCAGEDPTHYQHVSKKVNDRSNIHGYFRLFIKQGGYLF